MIRIVDIDERRLEQRYEFLLSRARAHLALGGLDDRQRMCAAMLWRDAGCVALFRDARDAACRDLARAGDQLLRLGIAAGSPLVALGEGPTSDRLSTFRAAVLDRGGSLARTMTVSARQLVSCLQTALLMEVHGDSLGEAIVWLRKEVSNRELDGVAVRETGLSMSDYVETGIAAIHGGGDGVEGVNAWFERLCARRLRDIETAAKDAYHWRLMPAPSGLLDLDSVILLYIALCREVRVETRNRPEATDHGPLVVAPLTVAKLFL